MTDSVPPRPDSADSGKSFLQALLLDQSTRWQRGELPLVEAYLARLPVLRYNTEAILDLITNEVLLRRQCGEVPALDEYLQRFPQWASELRAQFEVEGAIEEGTWSATPGFADRPQSALRTTTLPGANFAATPAVPGYEVLSELGRGAMGIVYLARQGALNRVVALKMILAGGHAGQAERRRFLAEAEAAASLDHPGIVRIHDYGTWGELPYCVLEFCPGGTLARRLVGKPLPPREAARLLEQVARAMQAAHERGIIHRDLKPGNIFLAADGMPRVGDFGLARRIEGGAGLTQTGAVLGTPSYMAPEQARAQKDVGPAADVYALGAILYECLTGRPPFLAATLHETLLQVISDEPAEVRRLNPNVPRDLETICHKCLGKDPKNRYASSKALAEDLRRFLADEPISAQPVTWIERVSKSIKRRPLHTLLLIATCCALANIGALWAGPPRSGSWCWPTAADSWSSSCSSAG
jgi:serine/threonine-protein kinase